MDPDQLLTLRRAGMYQFPADPSAVLPRVFGNFLDPLVLEPDPGADPTRGDGGFTPAVCVDTDQLIYCVNDGPAVATPPQIYWNGVLQEDGVAEWFPSFDLGAGPAAFLRFSLNVVRQGEVSVRFGGSVDGAGQPITNPIVGIYTMFTQYAGWTLADFDRGTCERTLHDMDALGYPFHACFAEERTIGEWLAEILPQYHADASQNGQGQLSIVLDRTLTTLPVMVDYHIPAYDIEDGGSPVTALQASAQAENVINHVVIHGRHNWVAGQPSLSYLWDYQQSQAAYQAAYPMEYTFRHMYTLAHATAWLQGHAQRHGFEPTIYTFTLNTLRGLVLIPPRVVTLEWPLYGWVQHLLKVTKLVISFRTRSVTLTCLDIGRELTDVVTSPLASPTSRRTQISRLYPFVPDTVGSEGLLPDAPLNPRNEAANGDVEQGGRVGWDLAGGNPGPQWEVIDNTDEAYQGAKYLRHLPLMGNGTAVTLRTRIDPGEWFVVSAWFRQHTSTDGRAIAAAFFYSQADTFLSVVAGNGVPPTTTYLESVAFGQAPPGAYYYRPGISFVTYPTFGQWRADHVFATSGTQAEVVAARQKDMVSRNFIINGDFESGPVMWMPSHESWFVTNNPGVVAHSGLWYAVHAPSTSGVEDRLNSLTRVAVTPPLPFTFQAFAQTINNPNGFGRLGVTWIDGQGNSLGENTTVGTTGPIVGWQLASGSMPVPAGAVQAHPWIGVAGHTGPADSYWLADTAFIYS